ncbi:MAG: hypothetical protein EAZ95_06765 [Bacteroidetes bacterium]|nr:MAG: hypothetical protein EAZ95_06765 [Bacteroidota bacterium]
MSFLLFRDDASLLGRSLSNFEADKSAVYALIQGAVNVELFTIPLYMSSLYSIEGKHQINAKGNNFYQGRWWPGMSITPKPPKELTPNENAFNKIFSVFIAEMLHLQMASNISVAIGQVPSFTSPALQDKNHGWICYGAGKTIIPHIVDLADFKDSPAGKPNPYAGVEVNIGALNAKQVELFLAVEEMEEVAEEFIPKEIWDTKYTHSVPFEGWTVDKEEADLPMFGTIGRMYVALWEYLSIQYEDGQTLWEKLYVKCSLQRDLFNVVSAKPRKEKQYPHMKTCITADASAEDALKQVLDMIEGITDQGEGREAVSRIRERLAPQQASKSDEPMVMAVLNRYQPSKENLEIDYPTYNDVGKQEPVSAQAEARAGDNGEMDHYEIFTDIKEIIKQEGFKTWDMWHAEGNRWQASDLITNLADYEENRKNHPNLPTAEEIAQALNNLKERDHEANYQLLSQASVGSLYGMTSVLDTYWKNEKINFPSPAMGGTGDRMSICWAIFGKVPDLSTALPAKDPNVLYHACQGMNLDPSQAGKEDFPDVAVFHTCIGSNDCRSQGGCGFVQSVNGGGNCSQSGGTKKQGQVLCGMPTPDPKKEDLYSAPSDNKCGGFGGCAVPISASQMFPTPKGKMKFFDFNFGVMALLPYPITKYSDIKKPDLELKEQHMKIVGWQTVEIKGAQGIYAYQEGELVYDVAWEAYTRVLQNRGVEELPEKPKPSDLRIAFPPST